MNKIVFPRLGADGKVYSQKDIEEWYLSDKTGIYKKIKLALQKEKNKKIHLNTKRKFLLEYLIKELDKILIAPPALLDKYKDDIDKVYKKTLYYYRYTKKTHELKRHNTKLCNRLLQIFKYEEFRGNILIELAKMLNIKVCPYCNQTYTLYVSSPNYGASVEFQFDHFYGKSKYPYLSMSLYNLIPSCANCNHRKSDTGVGHLKLNPYYGDSYKYFKFHVKDTYQLESGAFCPDKIEIEIIPAKNNYDIRQFMDELHIVEQYERHRDIVQDIYDKVYSMIYYEGNGLWNSGVLPTLQEADRKALLELWVGVPLDKTKIGQRPLTKFIQDIWEQATEEYHITNFV